jgi:hypothetical protein
MKPLIAHSARPWLALVAGIGTALSIMTAAHAASGKVPTEWDGLVRVEHKQLDHVYLLPKVSFAGYKRIRLAPVEVSFDSTWPNQGRSKDKPSAADMDRVRSMIADEFNKVLREELTKGGYTIVDENADDVLLVKPNIANLYITAPVKATAGPSRTYVSNSGRMTLFMELRDSATDQLLARAVDTVQARQSRNFQIGDLSSGLAEANDAMQAWAKILRKGLDDAEGRAAK